MAKPVQIQVWNPNGKYRVVSTKPMPGTRWINLLIQQDCRVEVISFVFLFAFACFCFLAGILMWIQVLYSFGAVDLYREEDDTLGGGYCCSHRRQVRRRYWTGNRIGS